MDEDLKKNPLWALLVETAHALPLYRSHKAYIKTTILNEMPKILPEELSRRLGMPLGEAIVILDELTNDRLV